MRTVLKRCDTRIVMPPLPRRAPWPGRRGPPRRSARRARARSRRRAPPSARRAPAAAAASRMNPRASASFCHWPNETSTPPGQVGPSWVSRPAGRRATTSSAPGPVHRGGDRRLVVEARHVAHAHRVAGEQLEAEEVLEGAGQARAPLVRPHARQRRAVHQDPPRRRLVQLAQQLDERRLARAVLPDERHHRARGQRRGRRRRAPGGRCRDRRTTRPPGGCPRRSRAGAGWSAEATSDAA